MRRARGARRWRWRSRPAGARPAEPEPAGYRGEPYRAPVPGDAGGRGRRRRRRGATRSGGRARSPSSTCCRGATAARRTCPRARSGATSRTPSIPGAIWLPNTGYQALAPDAAGLLPRRARRGDRRRPRRGRWCSSARPTAGCRGTPRSARSSTGSPGCSGIPAAPTAGSAAGRRAGAGSSRSRRSVGEDAVAQDVAHAARPALVGVAADVDRHRADGSPVAASRTTTFIDRIRFETFCTSDDDRVVGAEPLRHADVAAVAVRRVARCAPSSSATGREVDELEPVLGQRRGDLAPRPCATRAASSARGAVELALVRGVDEGHAEERRLSGPASRPAQPRAPASSKASERRRAQSACAHSSACRPRGLQVATWSAAARGLTLAASVGA